MIYNNPVPRAFPPQGWTTPFEKKAHDEDDLIISIQELFIHDDQFNYEGREG